jgi:hypothetical protein
MNQAVTLRPRVGGCFKLEAIRPDGSRRLLADWQENLITDLGLELLGSSPSGLASKYCHVGTGNATPAVGNTSLNTWLAVNTSKVGDGFFSGSPYGAQESAPYYGWQRGVYRFSAGTATGNLTEVGLSPVNTNAQMFSRALIKDGGGSPTTVTVLSDEMLDLTYEIRMYPPLVDDSAIVTISGTAYTFTIRAAEVDSANSWGALICRDGILHDNGNYGISSGIQAFKSFVLGAINESPTGTVTATLNKNFGTETTYAAGSHLIDATYVWDTDTGTDAAGFSGFLITTTKGTYQISVSPTIPKTGVNNLSLTFRVSWDRV